MDLSESHLEIERSEECKNLIIEIKMEERKITELDNEIKCLGPAIAAVKEEVERQKERFVVSKQKGAEAHLYDPAFEDELTAKVSALKEILPKRAEHQKLVDEMPQIISKLDGLNIELSARKELIEQRDKKKGKSAHLEVVSVTAEKEQSKQKSNEVNNNNNPSTEISKPPTAPNKSTTVQMIVTSSPAENSEATQTTVKRSGGFAIPAPDNKRAKGTPNEKEEEFLEFVRRGRRPKNDSSQGMKPFENFVPENYKEIIWPKFAEAPESVQQPPTGSG